jgi:hypothetical protein
MNRTVSGAGTQRWLSGLLIFVLALIAACGGSSEPREGRLGRTQQAVVVLTTDSNMYNAPAAVKVDWSGTPMNAQDWIAIAPAGRRSEQ